MSLSRRRFLGRTALAAAGAGAAHILSPFGGRLLARSAAAGNALRMPPLFSGGDLLAAPQSVSIWPDAPTQLMTLGGSYPAPTIRVRRGQRFEARLVNQISDETIIHWHGLFAPASMDGHPRDAVVSGGSKEYGFTVDQRAGLYWYHPHPDMKTGEQVWMGMAGLFIVEDDEEDALGLPSGNFEIPLVVQDRTFGPGRTLSYEMTMENEMTGMLGDTMLANGTPEAYHEVSRDLYRVRVVNGCNARVLRLGLDDGSSFHLIGGDGGLHDAVSEVTSVRMGPGERADILVDFSGRAIGTSVSLRTLTYGGATSAAMQGWGMDILRFDVAREAEQTATVPTALPAIQRLDPAAATATREVMLTMQHDSVSGMMQHKINGKVFGMERIDTEVAAGGTEVWVFRNMSPEPHPMHFHGAQFQVISRNDGGTPLAPEDGGWKDTVVVNPVETVNVVVRFGTEQGLFMLHCHNLEHEDTGMMSNILISATGGVGRDERGGGMSIVGLSPSPLSDRGVLTLHLAAACAPELRLYTSRGAIVSRQSAGTLQQGEVRLPIDVAGVTPGAYILEVAHAGGAVRTQLMVVR